LDGGDWLAGKIKILGFAWFYPVLPGWEPIQGQMDNAHRDEACAETVAERLEPSPALPKLMI